VLGHPPGGSYDLYARLAADHMKRFIPGNPNIIVQHRPGGGGVAAVLTFYAQAPRDGTMMGLFTETIGHTQILQPEVGRWKVEEMAYVGSFVPSNAALVVRKGAPAKTPTALRTTQINVGCTGANSQSYQYPASLKSLGGFRFNLVCGYPGSAEVILAIHRGEVDMFSGSWHVWRATQKSALDDGSLIPVIQGGLKRTTDLPNVPLMQELVEDSKTKKIIEFISGLGDRTGTDHAASGAGRPVGGAARRLRQGRERSGVHYGCGQALRGSRADVGWHGANLQRPNRTRAQGRNRGRDPRDRGREGQEVDPTQFDARACKSCLVKALRKLAARFYCYRRR
jgi:hypothetical protein